MHRSLIFLVTFIVLGAIALAQDKPRRVGEIDFYGIGGFEVGKIERDTLREGEDFPDNRCDGSR